MTGNTFKVTNVPDELLQDVVGELSGNEAVTGVTVTYDGDVMVEVEDPMTVEEFERGVLIDAETDSYVLAYSEWQPVSFFVEVA